jgi:hypothetical protein
VGFAGGIALLPTAEIRSIEQVSHVLGRAALTGAARAAVAQQADNRRIDGGGAPASRGRGPAPFSKRQ